MPVSLESPAFRDGATYLECYTAAAVHIAYAVASPAVGHWGTCPRRLPTISF